MKFVKRQFHDGGGWSQTPTRTGVYYGWTNIVARLHPSVPFEEAVHAGDVRQEGFDLDDTPVPQSANGGELFI